MKKLTASLTKMLSIFKPIPDMREFQSSIHNQIVKLAVDLAEKLQLSTDLYEIRWTNYAEGHRSNRERSMSDPEQYECVNLSSGGKVIKFAADPQRFEGAHITYILDICPGLYCRNIKSDDYSEPKVLKKPRILVAMPTRDQRPFRLWTPIGENATLLGSMDRQIQQRRGGFAQMRIF
jgi:hypothetical protein